VINHCEVRDLSRSGDMHEGAVSARLGLSGVPSAAESVMVARDCELALLTGGRLHIAHVSVAESIGYITRAKERGIDVSSEVTPHHLTMSEEWVYGFQGRVPEAIATSSYDTNTKVNPPLRTTADVDAVTKALDSGIIDAIATDHAPHAEVDKQCTYSDAERGINVLETAFGSLMTLVHKGSIGLETLLERLTIGPARVIGSEAGSLIKGRPADVVLLDTEAQWIVDTRSFASMSSNTPLSGVMFKGLVLATFVGGLMVHDQRPGDPVSKLEQ